MIQLPAGFDVAQLVADFYAIAAPFIGPALLISSGYLILKIFKRV